jgi:peptidoglycan-N-acetylglucosamine deacetylase
VSTGGRTLDRGRGITILMFILFAVLAAGILLLSHTAPFPFALDAISHEQVVWRMPEHPGQPRVYLTFDDGPNPAATPAVLDVLAREDAVATFFLIDHHITDDTAPIVRRIVADGHEIALHSGDRTLAFQSAEDVDETLERAAARIEQITGQPPCRAFRPHAGVRSGRLLRELDRLDFVMVGWGWNLWDWHGFRRRNVRTVARRLVAHASDGDIIVVHDGHHRNPRSNRLHTVETTALIVPALHARGFEFATVCEGLDLEAR